MRVLGAALNVILAVAYPIAIWVALTRWSARQTGLLILALVVPALVLRYWRADREHLLAVLRVPLVVLGVLLLAVFTDQERFFFLIPVLINLGLFAAFASSLRGVPLIERFARMQEPDLSEPKQRHCRQMTVAWCVFFVANATVAAGLSMAPMAWWAAYNGGIAYVLIGLMFVGEYVLRRYRFRDYGSGVFDRILARFLPPSAEGL